jgi:hypothetical protein
VLRSYGIDNTVVRWPRDGAYGEAASGPVVRRGK